MAYRNLSALVAGDSVATRSVLASLLLGLGLSDVRQARDGGEAFRQIRARLPDFVLLDFDLERDAIATLQQIRNGTDSPRRDLPVAIAVGFVTQTGVETMRNADVSAVLLKPATSNKLNACVQSLLADKGKTTHSGKTDALRKQDNS